MATARAVLLEHVRHSHRRYNTGCPFPSRVSRRAGTKMSSEAESHPSPSPRPSRFPYASAASSAHPADSSPRWSLSPPAGNSRRAGYVGGEEPAAGRSGPACVGRGLRDSGLEHGGEGGRGDGGPRAQHLKHRYESVGFSMSCTDMASGVRRRTQRPMNAVAMSGGRGTIFWWGGCEVRVFGAGEEVEGYTQAGLRERGEEGGWRALVDMQKCSGEMMGPGNELGRVVSRGRDRLIYVLRHECMSIYMSLSHSPTLPDIDCVYGLSLSRRLSSLRVVVAGTWDRRCCAVFVPGYRERLIRRMGRLGLF